MIYSIYNTYNTTAQAYILQQHYNCSDKVEQIHPTKHFPYLSTHKVAQTLLEEMSGGSIQVLPQPLQEK